MKYTKPPCWIECPIDVRDFLHSLPAEFEIVEPGNVQVKWPDGLTKQRLLKICNPIRGMAGEARVALADFAAIAPEEKKKRKMIAWQYDNDLPVLRPIDWTPTLIGWRKVGECEVDT